MIPELMKLGEMGFWLSIPITALVGWVYVMMEVIGDYSENPFQGMANDIPMLSLCRVIEIDLREMLGETDLPPAIESKNGVTVEIRDQALIHLVVPVDIDLIFMGVDRINIAIQRYCRFNYHLMGWGQEGHDLPESFRLARLVLCQFEQIPHVHRHHIQYVLV